MAGVGLVSCPAVPSHPAAIWGAQELVWCVEWCETPLRRGSVVAHGLQHNSGAFGYAVGFAKRLMVSRIHHHEDYILRRYVGFHV